MMSEYERQVLREDYTRTFLVHTCTVINITISQDQQNGSIIEVATETEYPCEIQVSTNIDDSRRGAEKYVGSTLRDSQQYQLALPHDAVIGANSRVLLDGVEYEVVATNNRDKAALMREATIVELITDAS